MKAWLRRVRGAVGMGLTWAVPAALAGFLMEIFVDPAGAIVDIWPAALAYPAFFGGVLFSTVLGIVAGRRRFDELSIPLFATLGAVGGLMLGLFVATVASGVIESVWVGVLVVAVPALGGSVAGAGSLALARLSEAQELLETGSEAAEVGLTPSEAEELLGRGG